jgi:hypothetical protein
MKQHTSGEGQGRDADGLASTLGSRRARTGSLVGPASPPPTGHPPPGSLAGPTSTLHARLQARWLDQQGRRLRRKGRLTFWHYGRHLHPCFSALAGCRSSAVVLLAWPRLLIPADRLLLLARPPAEPCPFSVERSGSTAAISPRLRAPWLLPPHTLADTPSTISVG